MSNKIKKIKVILDTSIQYERAKFQYFDQELDDFIRRELGLTNTDKHTSSYSRFEFRSGLISRLIYYYLFVRACKSVSDAKARISNNFGRITKDIHIVEAVMARLNKSIHTLEKDKYLRQLGFAILEIDKGFNFKTSGSIGSFDKEPLANFKLVDTESFKDFYKLSLKCIPVLNNYWSKKKPQLQKIVDLVVLSKDKRYTKMHDKLGKIVKDPEICLNSKRINQGLGDAIIATDYSTEYLIATDEIFTYICPALSKKYSILPKSQDPKIALTPGV